MNKRRIARNFLIADRVINIIGLVVLIIAPIVLLVVGIVFMVKGDFNGNKDEVAVAVSGLSIVISSAVTFFVGVPLAIVALVLNGVASRGLGRAQNRQQGRRPGVLAIVSGALLGTFGIPAGIIMLVMNDNDYQR